MKSKKQELLHYGQAVFSLCQAQENNCIESASLIFFDFSIYMGLVILNQRCGVINCGIKYLLTLNCDAGVQWLSLLHNFIQLSLNSDSNPARGVSEIRDGQDLWQWSWLEIRLKAFRRSTIPQKQFIIIINVI